MFNLDFDLGCMNKKPELFYTLSKQLDIFTAWRNGYYSFYYKSNCLFNYRNDMFTTHQKFALIFPEQAGYVSQGEIFKGGFSTDFKNDLPQIKANVKGHKGDKERLGVNCIACKHSYLKKKPIVVLDMEKAIPFAGKSDELDLVLLKGNRLRIVEAKLYSNQDIFNKVAFFGQVERYQNTIRRHKDELLAYYKKAVLELNEVFQLELQVPKIIEEKIVVLIFDYEQVQYEHRLVPLLQSKDLKGYLYYAVGDPKNCSIERLFEGKPCG